MHFPARAAAICILALAGCTQPSPGSSLSVSGPTAEVERFVRTQVERRPGLSVAGTQQTAPGESRVTFAVAGPATSEDVAEVSKAAIAARLSVSFTSGG